MAASITKNKKLDKKFNEKILENPAKDKLLPNFREMVIYHPHLEVLLITPTAIKLTSLLLKMEHMGVKHISGLLLY